ncbi:MAG: hypothetical protein JW828_05420 [Sedimentisphaerales bacterium]|nr:hypothetical protein [Sedimentisphaerales bacterium]
MDNALKHKLLGEFETMKTIEADAHDFYRRAADDPLVTDETMRRRFQEIADDELRHTELVERIMNLIRNCT